MNAAVLHGPRDLRVHAAPDPVAGDDQVVVRVAAAGLCGTDYSIFSGDRPVAYPRVMGHEFLGEVAAVGPGVTRLGPGDRVVVEPNYSCERCPLCLEGNRNLCLSRTAVGIDADGGFAELARVPAALAVRLPSVLSMEDGALVEPLAVSLYGVRKSGLSAGDRVVILGGGTVALYAIYWARRLGAGRIVALSRSDRRKALCLEMGADAFIAYGDDEVAEVTEALGGPADIVYECVGAEGMMMKAAMHASIYGKVVSLGFCTGPDPIMPAMAAYKCLTYQFLVGYEMRDFLHIADQMDKGHADPKAIVTNRVALTDLPATFEALRGPNAETKVHVLPGLGA